MGFFINMSTKGKLLASFCLVIIINILISISSIASLTKIQNNAVRIDEVLNAAFLRAYEIQSAVENIDNKFAADLGRGDDAAARELINLGTKEIPHIRELANSIRSDFLGTESYRKVCESLKADMLAAADSLERDVIPLLREGNHRRALYMYSEKAGSHFSDASLETSELYRLQTQYCIRLSAESIDRTPVIFNVVLATVGVVLALGLALFMANYMNRTLGRTMQMLQFMQKGDFAFHIGTTAGDEFGKSQEMIRSMRTTLSDIIGMTQNESNKLQTGMRRLKDIASKVTTVSDDIQNQATTVAAAANQMVSTTADIARNCESAAQGSDQCKNITIEGLNKVGEAVANIRQQSEHTKDNAAKIEKLARQSNDIGSIVSTIDDIAAQTNLLALNAAIEAARAGEAGRGFAVVADEVRALASRTTASTQEISRMVKNIQSEASVATESISASVTNMETVAEDSQRIMDILNEITDQVTEVNTQITQIATAAEQQTAASSEISLHMQEITQVTADVLDEVNVQNETIDSASTDLEKLQKAISFFKLHQATKA